MKQRVSDYISDFLVQHDISDVFMVTGGGAMYLDDSLGHNTDLHCTFNHHEQACAMAAEAYARIDNRIAAVCVTTGPGATNAITGVICGWMDSIPMLILSGQARYATTVYASGLKLRTRGVQEFDVIESVRNMTKYCELVKDPKKIRYCLEKALYLAREGRPGPCWLDIPLDMQSAFVETDTLEGYEPEGEKVPECLRPETIAFVIRKLAEAKRPVIYVGNGVRLAGAHEDFLKLAERLNVPVVDGMSSVDAIASDHRLFAGRTGTTGERAGNFAVQNSDVLLSLGSRLSYFQTGFASEYYARAAYTIVNDIDAEELEKDTIHPDLKLCCDVKLLIDRLLDALPQPLPPKTEWIDQCQRWRRAYPVVQERHYQDPKPNIYAFYQEMSSRLGKDDALVASCGTSRVAGSQASVITEGMRFITNPATASMGYGLPAAIGVCVARGGKKTVLVTGEGSFQMNIQELQTIVQNRLPVVIFIMNNGGYHSIRMTQHNYFHEPLIGVGPESGDLSFPDLSLLAPAYGLAFRRCEQREDMAASIEWALGQNRPAICEMMLSTKQITEPKVSSRKLEDGTMISSTLEDMAPFLPREEMKQNMYIPMIGES